MLKRAFCSLLFITTSLSFSGASLAQAVSLDVIQKYTPTIYLHPYDKNHPMAVEEIGRAHV